MKTTWSSKLSYIGGGLGLALFVVFGFLPGSFIGGAMGLMFVNSIFNSPSIFASIIIGFGMLMGVVISCIFFSFVGAMFGWLIGKLIDYFNGEVKEGKVIRFDRKLKSQSDKDKKAA